MRKNLAKEMFMFESLSNPKNKRIFGLDVLRSFAIFFVVLAHSRHLLPERFKEKLLLFILDGVSIFFVLSGFLIGGILIKIFEDRKVSYKSLLNFWIRRWFRTLPLYFLVLTVLVAINWSSLKTLTIFEYYTFSQNLFYPHPDFFSEAWSLSVEEWFYIIVPLTMFTIFKFSIFSIKKTILLSIVGLLILFTCFRFYRFIDINVNNIVEWDLVIRKQVFTRLDSVMFGFLGAYINFYCKEKWNLYNVQFFILGIGLLVFDKLLLNYNLQGFGFYFCVISFTLASVGTLLLLPFLSSLEYGNNFVYKFVTYISLISYSMYLINSQFIGLILSWAVFFDYFFQNKFFSIMFQYLFFWILTILVSSLIYKYFEIPFMNLRDKKLFR